MKRPNHLIVRYQSRNTRSTFSMATEHCYTSSIHIVIFFMKSEKYKSGIKASMPQPSCKCTIFLKLAKVERLEIRLVNVLLITKGR